MKKQELKCPNCDKRQRASIRDVFVEFCHRTSTRGLPRAAREESCAAAALWYVSVLVLFVFAVSQISLLCSQYFSYEVVQHEETKGNVQFEFPSVTVCNLSPLGGSLDKKTVLNVPSHLESLKSFYAFIDAKIAERPDYRDYLQQLRSAQGFYHNIPKSMHHLYGHSVFDMVNSCQIRLSTGFSTSTTKNCSVIRITQSPLFYNCFTVRLDANDAAKAGTLSLILYLDEKADLLQPDTKDPADMFGHSLGVTVYVHEPNTFPDTSQVGTMLGPGLSGRISLLSRRWQQLGQPYSTCLNAEEAAKQLVSHEGVQLRYSRTGCLGACLQRELAVACGCVEPSWPMPLYLSDRLPYCMNYSATASVLDLRRRLLCRDAVQRQEAQCQRRCHYKCTRTQFAQRVTSSAWPLPDNQLAFYKKYVVGKNYTSKFAVYEELLEEAKRAKSRTQRERLHRKLVSTDLISRNFLQVSVHRDSELRVIDEHAAYQLQQLFSGIGGIFSLTIGITLITCIELLELVYRLGQFVFFRKSWLRNSKRAAKVICTCGLVGSVDNVKEKYGALQ